MEYNHINDCWSEIRKAKTIEEVKGSEIEKREDGTTWLFDDEPIPEFPFYGDGRDEWVEVDEITVVRM